MALRSRGLAALALFVALGVLHTWPLASDPAHLARLDNDDAALNTWVIAWVAHILPRAPLQLFEAPIFFPAHDTLAYADHIVVQAVMGAPLLWAGVSPVLVHNLLFILGLILSGWAMCLVVTSWTGSLPGGLVAGMLYAFNAHALTRFPHLHAQHVEFLPVALYAMDRVLDRGTRRDAWLLAGAFVLQALCSNYFMVFTAYALVAIVAVRPAEWLARDRGQVRLNLVIAGVVSVVALAPFILPYYHVIRDQGLVRSLAEVQRYSAGWRDYLATGGRLHYALWSHRFFEGSTPLFPGITALVLAAIGVTSVGGLRDRRIRMTVAIGVMGFALSFGPALPGFAWMHTHVPLMSAARAAARFGRLALMAVAILAGYGVARLQSRWAGAAWWPAAAVIVAVLVSAEALRTPVGFTTFEGIPPIYDRLAAEPAVVLLELPLYFGAAFNRNGPYLLNNTRYWQPLVNGYSGFRPPFYDAMGERLQTFPAPAVTAELQALGVTHVTLHLDAYARLYGAARLAQAEAAPELSLVDEENGIRLYRLAAR